MAKEMSFEDFIGILETAADNIESLVQMGLNENSEDLLNESNMNAPIEQGDLMGSGSVEPAKKISSDTIQSSIGYDKEYALRMHEDVYNLGEQSQQKQKSTGRQVGRKYMERAVTDNSEKYVENLAKKSQGVFD